MGKSERIRYLDTLKLLAIFVVFATHFIDRFHSSYVYLWQEAPTAWILNGVTGKTGVAVFAVILGYFAYKSKEPDVTKYVIRRYIYFFLCALFINSVFAVLGELKLFEYTFTVKEILVMSLTLGNGIFKTLWCLRPFLAASILSKLNGKAGAGIITIAFEMIILIVLTEDVWTSVCLTGNMVAVAMTNEKFMSVFRHTWARAAVYIAVFFLIKRREDPKTYIIDGICVAMLILALSESRHVRKILDWEPLSVQGKNTMAMYLIHVVVYRLAGLATGLDEQSPLFLFIAVMAVSWAIIVALSFPLTRLLDSATRLCMKPVERLLSAADRYFET